jgi:hypothetical protein
METIMIEKFTKRWFDNKDSIQKKFEAELPTSYSDIVSVVVEMLNNEDEYISPDPKRIHAIDDGDYQGTLVYVIGATGYQPSTYWYVKVGYGSCSGCDTLENILSGNWGHETEEEAKEWKDKTVSQLMTLALHIVQGLKLMGDE